MKEITGFANYTDLDHPKNVIIIPVRESMRYSNFVIESCLGNYVREINPWGLLDIHDQHRNIINGKAPILLSRNRMILAAFADNIQDIKRSYNAIVHYMAAFPICNYHLSLLGVHIMTKDEARDLVPRKIKESKRNITLYSFTDFTRF